MADNYLERRMDDYRSGRLAASPHRRLMPDADAPAIHVHGADAAPMVGALRAAGARVSFSGVSLSEGSRLAQATGTTYCPLPPDKAVERMRSLRGNIDALVLTEATECLPPSITVVALCDDAPATAHRIVSQLSPAQYAALTLALAKIDRPVEIVSRNSVH